MAEPKMRFKRLDGSRYPDWELISFEKLYKKVIEKNDLSFGRNRIISVANMYFKEDDSRNVLDDDYMRTYNIMRLGDIAFEGNKSKHFAHGRFVENTIGDGIVSHVFDVFRPIVKYNLGYWKEYINYEPIMGKVLARCTKSSTMMTNLVANDFLTQKVFIPCPEEQQKIADFLSSVNEVIAISEQEVAYLEMQKKAVMKKIFSQEVRFKKEDGSNYPDWEDTIVKEIGVVVTGNTPSTKEEQNYGQDYLWVTPADITKNECVSSTNKKLSEKGWAIARHLPAGAVLVTCIASIGKNSILATKGSCNQQINAIIPNGKMQSRFILEAINYKEHDLQLLGGNGGMKIVSKSLFENFELPYPCPEEQQKIADFLSNFDEAIVSAKKELELWRQLKKGLLQQMFV